jgi:hypothetical protein
MKKERWKQSKGSGREEGFTAKFAKFAKLDSLPKVRAPIHTAGGF